MPYRIESAPLPSDGRARRLRHRGAAGRVARTSLSMSRFSSVRTSVSVRLRGERRAHRRCSSGDRRRMSLPAHRKLRAGAGSDQFERREERRAQRAVVHHHRAVLDRELRDARLVRGQEGLDARHRRQLLLSPAGRSARTPAFVVGHTGDARHALVELLERAHTDVGLCRQIHRRLRRPACPRCARWCACRSARSSGRTGRAAAPFCSPMIVPTSDSSWPAAGV